MLRVIGVYNGDLDALMSDLFKYNLIIDKWKIAYPKHYANLIIEIDSNNFYTLTLDAESNRKNNR